MLKGDLTSRFQISGKTSFNIHLGTLLPTRRLDQWDIPGRVGQNESCITKVQPDSHVVHLNNIKNLFSSNSPAVQVFITAPTNRRLLKGQTVGIVNSYWIYFSCVEHKYFVTCHSFQHDVEWT